jgi:undecaprenyl-diphosphatase
VAVLVFGVLALVVTHLFGSPTVRASAWALAFLAMAIVGFSRIELGVHWTTDVIGSLAFVALWLVAVVAVFRGELRASGQGELRT